MISRIFLSIFPTFSSLLSLLRILIAKSLFIFDLTFKISIIACNLPQSLEASSSIAS